MSTAAKVYLDYNASAPLCAEAADAMQPWLAGRVCNPSSAHRSGQRSRAAVEQARGQVAELLGCPPAAVVFTSGGTEADNAAVWGGLGWPPRGHLVISAIEHPAVMEPAAALRDLGVEVTHVPVDDEARVDPEAVRAALRPDTALVSIMAANNEVGSLQPVEKIAAIAHDVGALFHTDAVQAAAWIDLRPLVAASDLLSISSHKIAGPMGIGALYVRPGLDLAPLVRGGGQQGGRRGGTEATAAMVGFGAACARTLASRDQAVVRVVALRDRLEAMLLDSIEGMRRNGGEPRLPNTCHMSFARCDGNALVARLDLDGIAASAGAACASGVAHASPVMEALGVPAEYLAGALRLSLGYETTAADVDHAIDVVPTAVHALRAAGLEAVR
ncbi:MAG: cysteine desulfurase [Acidobacteria bacterium]|nr:cysteine desulfurase [Acidobacteriota bacterium]